MEHVTILNHPLALSALTVLRNRSTSIADYRTATRSLASLLISEMLTCLSLKSSKVITPLAEFDGVALSTPVMAVPILRAGLSLLEPFLELIPAAQVGVLGFERDEITSTARCYYEKLPKTPANTLVVLLDPMLATGGTLSQAATLIKESGGTSIVAVTVIAAPEGVARMNRDHPDIPIVTGAVDERLNGQNYIVPGLGDFGDRYYGTASD